MGCKRLIKATQFLFNVESKKGRKYLTEKSFKKIKEFYLRILVKERIKAKANERKKSAIIQTEPQPRESIRSATTKNSSQKPTIKQFYDSVNK